MKKIFLYILILFSILLMIYIYQNTQTKPNDDISKDIKEHQVEEIQQSNKSTAIILGIIVIVFFVFWKLFFR
jgi:uncharacterized membrane protein